eukprot:768356-Rhodomonas_salina.2
MIGVPNPHPLIASLDGECTTLVLTKEDADALFQLYPAERERIVENLLATYGLQPNGKDLVLSEEKRAETNGVEGWVEMREQVGVFFFFFFFLGAVVSTEVTVLIADEVVVLSCVRAESGVIVVIADDSSSCHVRVSGIRCGRR